MIYDYPTAFSHWGDEEYAAIDRVRASGQWTMADEVKAFETEFAEHHGMKFAVMVNSGSSANLVAVSALIHAGKLRRRDRVLVPALAWATTYAPLVQHDLELVLGDCDGTWCMKDGDLEDIQVIVDAPILGQPGYSMSWARLAKERNIPLLVDCCESLGSWSGAYGERTLSGTTGILNTFSFFHSHQLSAIEGGMILTNDTELHRWCKILRAHGWTRDVEKAEIFDDEYNFVAHGYNVRPLDLHAAVAREQLKKLEAFRRHREQGLNNFATLAIGLPLQMQGKVRGTVPSPFGIPFTVESKTARARVARVLRENGIDCRLPTGGCFTRHKYGEKWANQSCPNAERIHDTGLFLGLAPYDIMPLLERAVRVIRGALM